MKIEVTTIGNNRYIDLTPENMQEAHFGTVNFEEAHRGQIHGDVITIVPLENYSMCWRINVSAAVAKMNRESFQGMLSKQFIYELTERILDSVDEKIDKKTKMLRKLAEYEEYSYYVGNELTCNRIPQKFGAWSMCRVCANEEADEIVDEVSKNALEAQHEAWLEEQEMSDTGE